MQQEYDTAGRRVSPDSSTPSPERGGAGKNFSNIFFVAAPSSPRNYQIRLITLFPQVRYRIATLSYADAKAQNHREAELQLLHPPRGNEFNSPAGLAFTPSCMEIVLEHEEGSCCYGGKEAATGGTMGTTPCFSSVHAGRKTAPRQTPKNESATEERTSSPS